MTLGLVRLFLVLVMFGSSYGSLGMGMKMATWAPASSPEKAHDCCGGPRSKAPRGEPQGACCLLAPAVATGSLSSPEPPSALFVCPLPAAPVFHAAEKARLAESRSPPGVAPGLSIAPASPRSPPQA